MKTVPTPSNSKRCWLRLLLWALALNGAWEWVQCTLLYDMSGSSLLKVALWMLAATVADGLMVLAVVRLASRLAGKNPVAAPEAKGWAALLCVGLATGILVEWVARRLNLWNYGPLMPTLLLAGTTVGLVPLAQMAFLPTLSVWLAMRSLHKTKFGNQEKDSSPNLQCSADAVRKRSDI